MATKRKTTTAIVAGATAAALLLGGTFAWTSISQQAKNEAIVDINPGGRLHDDFNGTNKDVYVENFGDTTTGVDIFARIRLDQYFEVGQEAGQNKDSQGERNVKVEVGGVVYDEGTWVTYKPVDDNGNALTTLSNPVQANGNWQWTLGNDEDNKPYYMPTFNMNKDSLAADINGTYEGTVEGDIVHYDDYVKYGSADEAAADTNIVNQVTGEEEYDWDSDTVWENDENNLYDDGGVIFDDTKPIDDGDVYKTTETHTAKPINYAATIYTMAEWIALDSPVGPYWVYDIDGWAYWAQPIKPGETTGLLLDSISLSKVPDDNYYYGINVVGQFATAGDIYQFDKMSPEAEELFATVSGLDEIVISGADTIAIGETATYTATRMTLGNTATNQPDFVWSVDVTDGVTMDNGTLSVADTVAGGTKITVTATAGDGTATADGETTARSASKTVTVVGKVNVTAANALTEYAPGTEASETFTAQLNGANAADGTVAWTVTDGEGNTLTETTITDAGELTIGANETAAEIIVTATYKSNDGELKFSGTYSITSTEIETTDDMDAQPYALYTDDGAGGYTMTFVRSNSSITDNKSTYQGDAIVSAFSIDEDIELFYPDWIYDSEKGDMKSKVTSVSFANPIAPTSMVAWFSQFGSVKSVDFTNLDGSKLKSIGDLFDRCTAIESIDMSGVKVSKANQIEITNAFYGCTSLKELKVPENMTVVTNSFTDPTSLTFDGCTNLSTITGLETWDVSNVSSFSFMFYNCSNLQNINLTGWEFGSNTSFECMFLECSSLEQIPGAEQWDVSNVTNMTQTFGGCSALTLDCTSWNVSNVTGHENFNSDAEGVKAPTWSETTTE